MESTSASTFVASLPFNEIDYFVMLVMTAFLGWRIADMVRLHFKKLSKSKSKKLSDKYKLSEDDEAMVPQLKYPADPAQINLKGKLRIPPTQTPAARAAIAKPPGLEQLVSEIRVPPGLQHPQRSKSPNSPGTQSMTDAPWRKTAASAIPGTPPEDNVAYQLGRVVCWKETGYGFVVDEAGERLFVRQAEVEGGEKLRAGQLIRFRRGKGQSGQAAKALNVTLVSQEEARVMRQSGGSALSPTGKAQNKALAFPSAPQKQVVVVAPPTVVPAVQESSDIGNDDDLSAFLGSGSKEEQIKNLKYAPQWVADKFWSQHAPEHQEQQ